MKTAATLVSLLLSLAAGAGEILIPATYRGPGANGSVWMTEISVANVTNGLGAPVPVTITLDRADGTSSSVSTTFAPMESISIPDALASWFQVEEGGGLVRVTWSDASARITARARIYNTTPAGQFGQSVPAISIDRLASESILTGLSGVDGNRTNVGVSNPHDHAALFWIVLYDTTGAERGAFATSVPPRSYRQFNDIFSHFQAGPLQASSIAVSSTNATLYAWASIVRNDSGDPTFIAPAN